MSEIAKQIKAIIDLGLAPSLKLGGFRKYGTYYSRTKHEALQVINVQSSKWNIGSQGKFTVNIGVHFSTVAEMMSGSDPMPKLRRRVGMLLPVARDWWWTVTPQTDVSAVALELSSAWNDHVLPWLAKVETVSGAAAEMEEQPSLFGNLWTAAAARLVLGEPSRAGELVRTLLNNYKTQLETCHPANTAQLTSYVEQLSQWAADRNLPGFTKS